MKKTKNPVYRNIGWVFILPKNRRIDIMLGTIGGILVVVGTVIGAFDDVFNKK